MRKYSNEKDTKYENSKGYRFIFLGVNSFHTLFSNIYSYPINLTKGFSHSFLIYILILLILLFILLSHLLIGELSEGKYFTIIN